MARGPRERTGTDGLVVVDKPSGMSSHDVVSRVRRLAGTRKVGHAGTLDPMATGVLVLGVERATRLLGHLSLTDKTYDATIRLGATTVTDDAEGDVLDTADASRVSDDAIRAGLQPLTGEIWQRPSSVSAVKVDGVRSYTRVRSGEDVDLPARRVTVSQLDVVQVRREDRFVDVDVVVTCSSGTYIRALARDLGESLGVGGHLTSLRRTRVGPFGLDVAHTLDDLAEDFAVVPLAEAVSVAFPRLEVSAEQADLVLHGVQLPSIGAGAGIGADLGLGVATGVFAPDGQVLAVAERRDDLLAYLVVFS
jgi:tRNA pseudouridine55 synthase